MDWGKNQTWSEEDNYNCLAEFLWRAEGNDKLRKYALFVFTEDADWRRVWGNELPFLFVQLAPHRNTHPAFREAQHRIWQKTPRTAMVVTTDVGDANDIHPTRKSPVGERLALAARALSDDEPVEYSGPVFKSMTVNNGRALLSLTHVGAGLMAKGDSLKGFIIAGRRDSGGGSGWRMKAISKSHPDLRRCRKFVSNSS